MRYSYPYPPDRIGFPIISEVGDLVSDAGDAGLVILRALPAGDWVEKTTRSGFDWIGKAAKTKAGFFVLQLITNQFYLPLSQAGFVINGQLLTVGPQLASVVFAIPGVVAGKDFVEAYTTELAARIVALIEILGSKAAGEAAKEGLDQAKVLTDQIRQLEQNSELKFLFDQFKSDIAKRGVQLTKAELQKAGLSPEQIALKFRVRADAAAAAANAYLQQMVYRIGDPRPFAGVVTADYDINGNPIPPTTPTFPGQFRSAVNHAQRSLQGFGFLKVRVEPGFVDEPTRQALLAFQNSRGLPATGQLDSRTEAVILQEDRAKYSRPAPVPFPDPSFLTRGLPVVLGDVLAAANRYAPDMAPIVRQEMVNLSQGLALRPANLFPVVDRLRIVGQTPGAGAASIAADQLVAILAQPTTVTVRSPRPDTQAPSKGFFTQALTFAFLTAPLWGTILYLRKPH